MSLLIAPNVVQASPSFREEAEALVLEEANLIFELCVEQSENKTELDECLITSLYELNVTHEEIILRQEYELRLSQPTL